MTLTVITASDPGAPELAAVNGRLCGVLDWALPQAGWTIEHSAGNARVYRSVNGRMLHVNHDSAVSGNARFVTVRGCEGATSAVDIVNPYPTVEQRSNAVSIWGLGSGTAAAEFRLYILDDFFLFLSGGDSGVPNLNPGWDGGFFGQLVPTYDPDPFCSAIWVRASTTPAAANRFCAAPLSNAPASGDNRVFFQRDVTGAVMSSAGALTGGVSTNNGPGSYSGFVEPQTGYQGRILRGPMFASCLGADTLTGAGPMRLYKRGAIPQLWEPYHSGSGVLTTAHTFTDAAYNPNAVFRPFKNTSGTNIPWWIIEETDTWRPF